jgi:hypothetical protein
VEDKAHHTVKCGSVPRICFETLLKPWALRKCKTLTTLGLFIPPLPVLDGNLDGLVQNCANDDTLTPVMGFQPGDVFSFCPQAQKVLPLCFVRPYLFEQGLDNSSKRESEAWVYPVEIVWLSPLNGFLFISAFRPLCAIEDSNC